MGPSNSSSSELGAFPCTENPSGGRWRRSHGASQGDLSGPSKPQRNFYRLPAKLVFLFAFVFISAEDEGNWTTQGWPLRSQKAGTGHMAKPLQPSRWLCCGRSRAGVEDTEPPSGQVWVSALLHTERPLSLSKMAGAGVRCSRWPAARRCVRLEQVRGQASGMAVSESRPLGSWQS